MTQPPASASPSSGSRVHPEQRRSADFDDYASAEAYRSEVERSFNFAGLKHDLFVSAKAEALLALADRHVGDLRSRSALDVGCGVGLLQRAIAPAFGRSVGVDISGEALDDARRNCDGSEILAYDGERLPFEDRTFDVTFAVNVMHHVPPARWPTFARELLRVTRSTGCVAVFEHNPWNPLTRLAVFRCAFDADAVLLTRARTRDLLEGAGGSLLESRYILFVPVHARWARRVDERLGNIPAGAQYVVAARPS